jgi:hypothetical protein
MEQSQPPESDIQANHDNSAHTEKPAEGKGVKQALDAMKALESSEEKVRNCLAYMREAFEQ